MSEAESLVRRLASWNTSDEAAAGAETDEAIIEALDNWREDLDDDVDDIIKEARRLTAQMDA